MKKIAVGSKFTVTRQAGVEYERIADDPAPMFPCERMRVAATFPPAMRWQRFVFPAEDAWFTSRKMEATP